MEACLRRAVVARDLTKRYRDLEAVRSISFDVPAETCSGSRPERRRQDDDNADDRMRAPPTCGRLDVLGIPVTEHPRRVKSRMGVVPQEDNLDEEITRPQVDSAVRFLADDRSCSHATRPAS